MTCRPTGAKQSLTGKITGYAAGLGQADDRTVEVVVIGSFPKGRFHGVPFCLAPFSRSSHSDPILFPTLSHTRFRGIGHHVAMRGA